MKTAAIAIDNWKLAIFKSHLDRAGYAYTKHPGVTADTLFLKVTVPDDNLSALQTVVEAAQRRCKTQ